MWWYRLELSTKSLLDHWKSMKELNWTVLTIAILQTFFTWYKSQSCNFKMKCVFIHYNAPHISKLTSEFFENKRFTDLPIIGLPPNFDLNSIKSLWWLYEGAKQYNSKVDLWEAIKITIGNWTSWSKKINKLNNNRLRAIIVKKCPYIKM